MINIENNIEALYIHIPFCNKICNYCDFYKMVANSHKEKYVEYLVKEIEIKKDLMKKLKTIYIGGGTPSSLPLNLMDYLLYHLFKYVDNKQLIEFTVEVNPVDVTVDLVKLLKKYHVNRVSIGVQSFNEEKLKFLGRDHNKKVAVKAIKTLKKYGIKNLSIDIMYATPNDSFKKIKKDLIQVIKLNVNHVSTYSLILEEKTILHHLYKKNLYKPFDADEEYKIYLKLTKFLKAYGYNHYEISNFAKPKYESHHNLVYWTNKKYLGIGAGASYYINNIRYTNVMNLNDYYIGIDSNDLRYQETAELTKVEQMQEEVILGLRMVNGINLIAFKEKYNVEFTEAFPIALNLVAKKLLKIKKHHIYIPEKKLYLSNSILTEFI